VTSEKLSNTLRVERARHNLTQEQLAERVGVSRKTINTIERGIFVPSTILALKLARVLQISVEELFTLEQES
jgi:putative transcriptional regulator